MSLLATGNPSDAATFGDDLAFLKKHTNVIVLGDADFGGQVALVAEYQGRVMTSTTHGSEGLSFGWINRELIASGKTGPHINVYGGEDRFWLGPEGGQYSIFFKAGSPFDLEHWQTPPLIDTEPFDLKSRSAREAVFTRHATLTNYSGTTFALGIERTIRLLAPATAASVLGLHWPEGAHVVAYESVNALTNKGQKAWERESGLLSIWILGMFNPSPETTVVIPYVDGPEDNLGPVVNDAYFGKVPDDRLVARDGVIFFSGDGEHRAKIGLSPQRAKNIAGSYDARNKVLTLVHYDKPADATEYVNSMWELQDKPYAGDVVNAYNDGPPAPGKPPLGPFYELETSSPAAALAPGETITHTHRTIHVEGDEAALDRIAKKALGVGLEAISSAFSEK